MSKNEIQMLRERDTSFYERLRKKSRSGLERCYQCSACSDGCPVIEEMDYYPNQLIHMVRLGLKDEVLRSRSMWVCASCETCATRCPNQIDIVRFMDVLRSESLSEKIIRPMVEVSLFHQTFLSQIRKRGRIHELALMLSYKFRTGELFSLKRMREDAQLGLAMFRKGKLKVLPEKVRGRKEIKTLFKKISSCH